MALSTAELFQRAVESNRSARRKQQEAELAARQKELDLGWEQDTLTGGVFGQTDADSPRLGNLGPTRLVAGEGFAPDAYETSATGFGNELKRQRQAEALAREQGLEADEITDEMIFQRGRQQRDVARNFLLEGYSNVPEQGQTGPVAPKVNYKTVGTDQFGRQKVEVRNAYTGESLGERFSAQDQNTAYNLRANVQARRNALPGDTAAGYLRDNTDTSVGQFFRDQVSRARSGFERGGAGLLAAPAQLAEAGVGLLQKGTRALAGGELSPEVDAGFQWAKDLFAGTNEILGINSLQETVEERAGKRGSLASRVSNRKQAERIAANDQLLEQQRQERIANGMSEFEADALKFKDQAGFVLKDYIQNPGQAAGLASELAGQIGLSAITGGVGGALVRSNIKKKAAKAGKNWRDDPELVKQYQKSITAIATASGTAQEASNAAFGVRQDIESRSEEQLQTDSSEYRKYRKQGLSHEEARTRLAREAASNAFALTTAAGLVITPALSRLGLSGEKAAASVLNPRTGVPTAASRFRNTLGLNAVRGAAGETIEETLQEGSATLASNIATRLADPNQELTEGLAQSMVEGAIGGTVPGAAVGTVNALKAAAAPAARAGINKLNDIAQKKILPARPSNPTLSPKGSKVGADVPNVSVQRATPQDQKQLLESQEDIEKEVRRAVADLEPAPLRQVIAEITAKDPAQLSQKEALQGIAASEALISKLDQALERSDITDEQRQVITALKTQTQEDATSLQKRVYGATAQDNVDAIKKAVLRSPDSNDPNVESKSEPGIDLNQDVDGITLGDRVQQLRKANESGALTKETLETLPIEIQNLITTTAPALSTQAQNVQLSILDQDAGKGKSLREVSGNLDNIINNFAATGKPGQGKNQLKILEGKIDNADRKLASNQYNAGTRAAIQKEKKLVQKTFKSYVDQYNKIAQARGINPYVPKAGTLPGSVSAPETAPEPAEGPKAAKPIPTRAEPEKAPEKVAEPQPEPTPKTEPEPEPTPPPTPEPEPSTEPPQGAESGAKGEGKKEKKPELKPKPVPELEPVLEPKPVLEPEPKPEPLPKPEPKPPQGAQGEGRGKSKEENPPPKPPEKPKGEINYQVASDTIKKATDSKKLKEIEDRIGSRAGELSEADKKELRDEIKERYYQLASEGIDKAKTTAEVESVPELEPEPPPSPEVESEPEREKTLEEYYAEDQLGFDFVSEEPTSEGKPDTTPAGEPEPTQQTLSTESYETEALHLIEPNMGLNPDPELDAVLIPGTTVRARPYLAQTAREVKTLRVLLAEMIECNST